MDNLILILISVIGIAITIAGFAWIIQDSQIPYSKKRIEQVGVEVYCSEVASNFAKRSYNSQWGGGDPDKGVWSNPTEKVYNDCIQSNN